MNQADYPETLKSLLKTMNDTQAEFNLVASPTAISVSDIFFSRLKALCEALEEGQVNSEYDDLAEALGVLREVLKYELFFFSPLFQYERSKHRRKWKRFVEQAGAM